MMGWNITVMYLLDKSGLNQQLIVGNILSNDNIINDLMQTKIQSYFAIVERVQLLHSHQSKARIESIFVCNRKSCG